MPADTWERAKEIFGQAMERPDEERAAFVEEACAADTSLREQVEALLKSHKDAGEFMKDPTDLPSVPAAASGGDISAQQTLRIESGATVKAGPNESAGKVIGRYKLLQQIGEGGFGEVWMAEQEEPVRRRVALKIIKLGMDTKEVIARFEAERQALAMMDHPNIAKVFDAGVTDTGRPYFVMELVMGEPMTRYCDRHNLSVEERLMLFQQTCRAVQHAHQKGIIHRDLKPSNVLITLHDGRPAPKVIDFGIAKATNARLTEKTVFTEYRQLIGTPEYMSPEQAEMGGLDIDTRSDVYSLGVLLYELLTGTTPFDSESLRSAGYAEIQRIIREETPRKPSTRLSTLDTLPSVAAHRHTEPKKLGLLIRGDLDWIVMKALEKDRTRRYETANGFAADIQRYLDNEPTVASPPSRAYRVRKFVRRNRAGVATAAVIGVLLVLGVAGTTWGMLWALDEKDRANAAAKAAGLARIEAQDNAEAARLAAEQAAAEAERARIEGAKAERVADFTLAMLSGIDPEFAKGADTTLMEAMLDEAADRLTIELADEPEVRRQIHSTIGHTYWSIAKQEAARKHLEAAYALAVSLHLDDHIDTVNALADLAKLAETEGDMSVAERCYRDAIEMARRLGPSDADTLARTLRNLATALTGAGRYPEAEAALFEVIEILRDRSDDQSLHTRANAVAALAVMRHSQQCIEEAAQLYEEALALERSRENPALTTLADILASFGALNSQRGAFEPAGRQLEEAVQVRRNLHHADHPRLATTIDLLAMLRRAEGRLDEALALNMEAYEMRRRLFGDSNPITARSLALVGITLTRMGRIEEAYDAHRRQHAVLADALGPDHPDTIQCLSNVGYDASLLDRHDEAHAALSEAYERAKHIAATTGPDEHVINVTQRYADYLQTRDRFGEAEPLLLEVVEHLRSRVGDAHPDYASAINGLAILYMRTGRPDEAIPRFREAVDIESRTIGVRALNAIITRMNLAGALRDTGRPDEAEPEFQRVIEYARESLPENHWRLGMFLASHATNLTKLGRYEDALADRSEALAVYESALGLTHSRTSAAIGAVADALRLLGRLEEIAALWANRVQALRDAAPENTELIAKALIAHAGALTELSRFDEAEGSALEGHAILTSGHSADDGKEVATAIETLIALYDVWHEAEPDNGYDARAAEWRAKLPRDARADDQ